MKPESSIRAWHAHVYYGPGQKDAAAQLREAVGTRFPEALLGRWHDALVGPHTRSMYQIAFRPELFPTLVPFIALNRGDLAVLVHPETGRQRDDHLRHALWMGEVLPVNADALPEDE